MRRTVPAAVDCVARVILVVAVADIIATARATVTATVIAAAEATSGVGVAGVDIVSSRHWSC